jgi:hypothetical protein
MLWSVDVVKVRCRSLVVRRIVECVVLFVYCVSVGMEGESMRALCKICILVRVVNYLVVCVWVTGCKSVALRWRGDVIRG